MIFGEKPKIVPDAYNSEMGRQHIADLGLNSAATEILSTVSGTSPYLAHLMTKEATFIRSVIDLSAEAAFDTACNIEGEAEVGLRSAKRRVALTLALLDLTGLRDLEWVTAKLSDFADQAVDLALRTALKAQLSRQPHDEIDPNSSGGIFCLAMGKLGGRELNYSSDIDLIFLFDDSRYAEDIRAEIRAIFVKVVQKTTALLSNITAEGYVFRTDLRLRPNPAVTPVCASVSAAANYYIDHGRTWERAAFIKARVCAGDNKVGAAFLERMQDFIWRGKLDYAALEDIQHQLKLTRDHKGLSGPIELKGHNLKLGRGGIREIEFFVQTHQLIFGGRHERLRGRNTVETLNDLFHHGVISDDVVTQLTENYRTLRMAEHRIQMLRDAQTHSVPKDADYDRFLCLYGREQIDQNLKNALQSTEDITFEKSKASFSQPAFDQHDAAILNKFEKWAPLRSERAQESLLRLMPAIHELAKASDDQEEALALFEGFLTSLPESVQPLAMLEQNPNLLRDVFTLVARSRYFGFELARNFESLYGHLDPISHPPSFQPDDIEASLIAIRKWKSEAQIRIILDQLLDCITFEEAEKQYTALAETCLTRALEIALEETRKKHGAIEGSEVAILGMGKLASREMTARSDLDLIILYDGVADAMSDGAKPTDLRSYYTFFTRRLITAISVEMAGGRLYEVDMRLRPSGRAGTVATSLSGFEEYQFEKAWVWEHLALTRARVVSGPATIQNKVEALCKKILLEKADNPEIIPALQDMRDRLGNAEIAEVEDFAVKKTAGGLLDIELLAQSLSLIGKHLTNQPIGQLEAAMRANLLTEKEGSYLIETHQVFSHLEHLKRILEPASFTLKNTTVAGSSFLLQKLEQPTEKSLSQMIAERLEKAKTIVDDVISRMGQSSTRAS